MIRMQPSQKLLSKQNQALLFCAQHLQFPAQFKLIHSNEQKELCKKCAIKYASLGFTIQKISREPLEINIKNKLRKSSSCQNRKSIVISAIQKFQSLNQQYIQKRQKLKKICKSHQKRRQTALLFYNFLIFQMKGSLKQVKFEHSRISKNNCLCYQRTCNSLMLISRIICDLQKRTDNPNLFQQLKCSVTDPNNFYAAIIGFFEAEYLQLLKQMNSPFVISKSLPERAKSLALQCKKQYSSKTMD